MGDKDVKNKKWCVYKHTSPSNKVYIGITSLSPNQRWANGLGYRKQTVMWRAIQKYGWPNFKHEILENNLVYEEALKREIYYIEKYKSNCKKYKNPTMGYNMDDGGTSGHGHPLSKETKYKLSHSKYHLDKRRAIDCYNMEGYLINTYPDLNSIQIDYPTIAKTNITKNCRNKIKSVQGFRFFYHEITNGSLKIEPYYKLENIKTVSQYTLNGLFVKTFYTLSEAAKSVGTYPNIIKEACDKARRTVCGFQWVYGSKEENGVYIEPETNDGYIEYIKNKRIYKIKDLVGQKFNLLTVLKKAEDKDFQYCKSKKSKSLSGIKEVHWLCRCDCGNLVTVSNRNLTSGHTKSCGCLRFKDLTGMKIGNLTIIEKYDFTKNRENIWRCKCKCGNETFKSTSYFSKNFDSYMCEECAKNLKVENLKNAKKEKYRDLMGFKVGLLTVIDRAEDYISPDGKHKMRKWKCKCECGGITDVEESNLLRNRTLSCGCLQKNLTGKVRVKEDLTGKIFGRWKVLYQGEDIVSKSGRKKATWVCQCSCEKGSIKTISQAVLKAGVSKSCGCLNSELSSERIKKYNNSR